jgi:hypothetical protein
MPPFAGFLLAVYGPVPLDCMFFVQWQVWARLGSW